MAPKIRGNGTPKCRGNIPSSRTLYPQDGGIWSIYSSYVPYVIAAPMWNLATSGAVLNAKQSADNYYIPRPGEVYTTQSANSTSFNYSGAGLVPYFSPMAEIGLGGVWQTQNSVSVTETNIKYRMNNAINWTTQKLDVFLGSRGTISTVVTLSNGSLKTVPAAYIKNFPSVMEKLEFQFGFERNCVSPSWATGTRTLYRLPHTFTYKVGRNSTTSIIQLPTQYFDGLIEFDSYKDRLNSNPGIVTVTTPDGSIGETLSGWELMPVGDRNLGRNPKSKIPTSVVLTTDGQLYVTKLAATTTVFYSVLVRPEISNLYGLDFGGTAFKILITT